MYGRSESNEAGKITLPTSVKIIVSGGFGVGKTTLIGAISEIDPLVTEAVMTEASVGIDDTRVLPDKLTTTVAFDFGRVTLGDGTMLYLFGTPGQERFTFLWDDLSEGAFGAVILLDTRRIEDCYPVLDYFEKRATPTVLAVNQFDGADQFELDEIREALRVDQAVPLIRCDARQRESVKDALVILIEQVLSNRTDSHGRRLVPQVAPISAS